MCIRLFADLCMIRLYVQLGYISYPKIQFPAVTLLPVFRLLTVSWLLRWHDVEGNV